MTTSAAISPTPKPESAFALGMRIDGTSYQAAVEQVTDWAARSESRAISVATVHMVMEAYDHREYRGLVNSCDLVTPDGMPLVWVLRASGISDASRVYGPDLTLHLLERAAQAGIPVGFYGATESVIESLLDAVRRRFPAINIAYAYAPPFRPLEPEEEAAVISSIVESGTRILFVGLGCPKQERWIVEHRGLIPAVMLGVGAAFDFLSGKKRQAPHWMQNAGLEWLFRLITEPRRLFWRYMRHNPRFVHLVSRQLWSERRSRRIREAA